ncbi:pre-rRNA processing protein [Coemansia guatemalensis]|uniref:Pre-rRNA processing protein n=1 Tax=Coemansia guatemalensis TaxID=2761395 RepID=A0A9W8HWC6_9FUNG|nr:pre-rRNA processing protein [Coemansia guatemalensis]
MAKDRFLAQGVTTTKRQRNGKVSNKSHSRKAKDNGSESEDGIGDVEDLEHRYGTDTDEASSSDEDAFLETAAEKRLRLAKNYIDKVKASTDLEVGEYDAAQIDRDLIAERLMTDAQERSGKWSRRIAVNFAHEDGTKCVVLKNGHRLPVTCVAVTPNGQYVYSGCKDGRLVKWKRDTGAKLAVFRGQKKKTKKNPPPNHNLGHSDHILAIAISGDNKYVATGGRDRRIHIWSIEEDKHLAVFHQHKDSVTGLVFRRSVNQLYSCSADRMVKLWNIDELGYMDTLFGHQDGVLSIAALQREQAVTVGGRDKTVRLWKIADETQLVFRGGSSTDQHRITKALLDEPEEENSEIAKLPLKRSAVAGKDIKNYAAMLRALASNDCEFSEDCIDCVAMIDEETYVTGGDSGALSLWSMQKKKPVFIHHLSHGVHPNPVTLAAMDDGGEMAAIPARPHWITALAAVPFTDLFFSASSDGWIRMWQLRPGKAPGFDLLNAIPVAGYVNGLSVCELAGDDPMSTRRDVVLAAAVGQEPRLGRWEKQKARNVVKVFQLPSTLPTKKARV